MNLSRKLYTDEEIEKLTYMAIFSIMCEIISFGRSIAMYRELKSLRKLIDESLVNTEDDRDLLRILEEPHVKLASELADYLCEDWLENYALMNSMGDYEDIADERLAKAGKDLAWRYITLRNRLLRRDRYLNFSKMLFCAQRAVYELLKLAVNKETQAFDDRYRTNYSDGRVKALMKGNENYNTLLLEGLIGKLKEAEAKSRALT